jgi:hypothetical protein
VIFVIFFVASWVIAMKNYREIGLAALLFLSITFVALSYFGGSFESQVRTTWQLFYAISVLGVAAVRLLMIRRSSV